MMIMMRRMREFFLRERFSVWAMDNPRMFCLFDTLHIIGYITYFRYVEILYRYHISIEAGVQQDGLFENRITETRGWTKLFFYGKLRYNNNLWKKTVWGLRQNAAGRRSCCYH